MQATGKKLHACLGVAQVSADMPAVHLVSPGFPPVCSGPPAAGSLPPLPLALLCLYVKESRTTVQHNIMLRQLHSAHINGLDITAMFDWA